MKYQVIPFVDNINHRRLYMPQPAAGSPLDLLDIAHHISQTCTLTRPDVMAVLAALEDSIALALLHGHSVRLGCLGSFRIRMKATPAARPEDVTAANVRGLGIAFRPSPYMKRLLMKPRLQCAARCLPAPYAPEEIDPFATSLSVALPTALDTAQSLALTTAESA